jgi:hypothetical protein
MNMHHMALRVEEELRRAEREGHASLQMSGRFQVGLASLKAAPGVPLKVLECHGGDWMVRVEGNGLLAVDLVLGKAKVCVGDGWSRWL